MTSKTETKIAEICETDLELVSGGAPSIRERVSRMGLIPLLQKAMADPDSGIYVGGPGYAFTMLPVHVRGPVGGPPGYWGRF